MAETVIKDIGKKERKPEAHCQDIKNRQLESSMKDKNTATTVILVIIRSLKK